MARTTSVSTGLLEEVALDHLDGDEFIDAAVLDGFCRRRSRAFALDQRQFQCVGIAVWAIGIFHRKG